MVNTVRFSAELAHLVQRQRGVVTSAQLHRHGVGGHDVDRLCRRGVVTRVHHEVFRVGDGRHLDCDTLAVVACLVHERGVIGGASAAAMWRFDLVFRPVHPEFLTDDTSPPLRRVRGVTYRSCDHLDRLQTHRRLDGVRLLTRAETWLDCIGDVNTDRAIGLTRHVLDEHCTADELLGAVERWESPRSSRPPGRSRRLVTSLAS